MLTKRLLKQLKKKRKTSQLKGASRATQLLAEPREHKKDERK